MMKILAGILSLFFLSGCTTRSGQSLLVFKAGSGSKFVVSGQQEAGDGIIWMEDTSDLHAPPVFRLTGPWDLSGHDRIRVVLVNGSARNNMNATIRMEGKGRFKESGSLVSKRTLKDGETLEWIISIPPSPENPEIMDKMTGMRATPFSMDGVTSSIDPGKITGIFISFDKWLKGTRLGIKEISAIKGPQIPAPRWFAMPEQAFFPFIDKYGQFLHKDWPGKTKDDSSLAADRLKELNEMERNPGPGDRNEYGGWLKGKRLEATGNFYVHKVDGKWWMVDPDGYLFWSHGVVRVTPSSAVTIIDNRENYFSSLPDTTSQFGEFYRTRDEFLYQYYRSWGIKRTFDFSSANLSIKYGEGWRSQYRDMVYKRLRNWGMNTISAGSEKTLYRSVHIPYCDRIELRAPRIEGAPERLNVIKDPFHPGFSKDLIEQLQDRKEELQSKWCYGYFIDNKLVWGADHDLGRWVLMSPGSQPSKIVFVEELKRKYKTIQALNAAWKSEYGSWKQLLSEQKEPPAGSAEDCTVFSGLLIEEYFRKTALAMRQTAPGKLYLGCRYVTVNERVLRIAAKYCDVLTFDLFVDDLSDLRLPEGVDKPVLIGEFHFGALDRGLFHPGLNQKSSQDERGLAYEKYVRSALQHPFIIGTSWHQFSDQATTGRFDGENFQDGLTDVCDKVYPETVNSVKKIGEALYRIRSGEEE